MMSEREAAATTTRRTNNGVSNHVIARALELAFSDPNAATKFTSLNAVINHLETYLGLDLTHNIDFIRSHIQILLRSHVPPHPPPKAEQAYGAGVQVPKQSAQTVKKRRGGPGGLNKLCGVTPELQVIVGQSELARTEIVKQLWAYIRKNNLQDPSNKRKIICNDELRLVFETDCTDMFKMNKLLSKHIITLEPTKATGQSSKKPKVEVGSGKDLPESDPIVIISESLANVFGTCGREMPQSEASRLVWQYAKLNQLEDPMNPMAILCDTKLQELLGCVSISAMAVPEMLARLHLFKR